ncbi:MULTISPECIES: hypothetical protein [Rodentibacter]|uniref:hypothetical protein n=1 Tax=Rodentibacter TaxID=1960084 RepID=UPI001CFDBFC3|nr:hypothetical protein [Rodentibacter sp. JRC1]GJI56761.1 hypothetical protein HEMROJRC1_18730 [Rodentibacter sp. JRC1]
MQYSTYTLPVKTSPTIFQPYTQSELLALSLGFVEIQDPKAYRGRYFLKAGKKWIHNIEALRRQLNSEYGRYIDDGELSASSPEGFGYDVEAYYIYNCHATPISLHPDFIQWGNTIRLN